jgi:ABC-type transport system involved in cytochrome c biogenesis permease component
MNVARPFPAMVGYALRVCVPARRWFLLALPFVGAVLFGLLAHAVELDTAEERFAAIAGNALFALVLPLACLVVGDAVLGAEVRSGTFSLTWLSPVAFGQIVVARWLAGWALACAVLIPAHAAAALIAGVPEAIGPLLLATVTGAAAYIGLFVFIGATVRRAALWSLAIVLLGERLLGTALSGIAQLSPQWEARNVYAVLGPDAEDELLREGIPSGWGAVVRLALITVVTVGLAIWRVRNLKLTGKED